ncbi:MAG: hypothetical protein VKO39_13995 [Cyanobacteriota bacterium]|nr:hypothetical protein [Cyanobacteriota bacterium]
MTLFLFMAWDPSVLRKYSTTSHFRLLNQVRSELNAQPISRHPDGEIHLGISRRAAPYRVPVEVRGSSGGAKSVKTAQVTERSEGDTSQGDSTSFRDRLRAIEMR